MSLFSMHVQNHTHKQHTPLLLISAELLITAYFNKNRKNEVNLFMFEEICNSHES